MALKKVKTKKVVAKKVLKKKQVNKKRLIKKTSRNTPAKKVFKSKTVKSKTAIAKKPKTISRNKKTTKKILIIATDDKCFWINEGPSVKDLIELRNALLGIKKEQFIHHVNGIKNDFAIWVEEVLQDNVCASGIRKAKSKTGIIKNIEKSLLGYRR